LENSTEVDNFIDFIWQRKHVFHIMNDKIATRLAQRDLKTEDLTSSAQLTGSPDEVFDLMESDESSTKKTVRLAQGSKTQRLLKEIEALRYLKREVDELEDETGRYELYIGYPFVSGNLSQDIQLMSPLMLFPVNIAIEKNQVALVLPENKPALLNKALILAYAKERNIKIDSITQEFFLNEDLDVHSIYEILDYLEEKGIKFKYVKRKGVIKFEPPTSGFEKNVRLQISDAIEVKHMAVLGRFPLANSIYNDYLALEKDNLSSPSIEMLLNTKTIKSEPVMVDKKTKKKSNKIEEQDIPKTPYFYGIHDVDYAQEKALETLEREDNVVIYGPPGTGKSQTIVNIISDALCKKKRVLVISQKRAALDVVFSRLGALNSKAMLVPDPERDKPIFYERLVDMHEKSQIAALGSDIQKHVAVEQDIRDEIKTLMDISNTLYKPTRFGLNLQEMYAASYNIGQNSNDYAFYNKLKDSNIINRQYAELSADLKLINDKNLHGLYLKRIKLLADNEIIAHLLPNIEMHHLKEARTVLLKFIEENAAPFNVTKYPYSRYLTTFYLEEAAADRRSIERVSEIITEVEHPKLVKFLRACAAIPLLWPAYFFVKYRHFCYKEDIKIDLNIAKNALEGFEENYKILHKVIDPQCYALSIGGIINGNTFYLRKLLDALDNYIAIRDVEAALSELSPWVVEILDFAYKASDKTLQSFQSALDKIMPIRIYHEILAVSPMAEQFLSKTITFNDLRNRILALKADQREISRNLAIQAFTEDYANHFAHSVNSKDYLYEIKKSKRLKPIRTMFEHFEDYLLLLFPCWLLSPDVVSTVFPLKEHMFDLIVFDEASQIFIESALPAIYRGDKVVVSGDNKQLRPSALFLKRYLGDYVYLSSQYNLATQAALEVESLLDLATSRYTPVQLTYHYRSEFAELIDFSNAAFYDNRLQVAPNIKRRKNEKGPIERIKVKGVWNDRKNHEEAAMVVRLVKSLLGSRPMRESIGIVTFNIEQKEYIEDLLDAEAEKSPQFAKQLSRERNRFEDGENVSIFVKNLENVQGEERDIIIFSIGYAKNTNDVIYANFGALSMEGGENRLNVAITRAKKKVYVVTSIEPEELDRVETSKNNGPRLLKRYLQYARAVSDNDHKGVKDVLSMLYIDRKAMNNVGRYEEQIKYELEKLGYNVDINIGNTKYKLSLAIYDESIKSYVLGIECDYQAFNTADSVMESDVYRIKFLENRGWTIMRVWSRDWWISREKVLEEIVSTINKERMRKLDNLLINS
jgi:DNA polymerase III delta prime subunit